MPDPQKRKHHCLPELQRNIVIKYNFKNIIKHNTKPNKNVLDGNYKIIPVRIHAKEIDE